MVSTTVLAALLIAGAVQVINCGDVPETTCGILFSQENFCGESFTLDDFDQSGNLKRDYRLSREGWMDTKSIRVENGCTMTICSELYFQGSCRSFTSEQATPSQLLPNIKSVNCTCERSCRCEDFADAFNEQESSGIGRIYAKGGCDICDSEYVLMSAGQGFLRSVDFHTLEAVILLDGCSITFYTEEVMRGDKLPAIKGRVYRGRIGTVKSYETACEPGKPKNGSSKYESYVPLKDLPVDSKDLNEMVLANSTLANHPGIRAALDSVKINRSSRRAYVMVIGGRNLEKLGFPGINIEHLQLTNKYAMNRTGIREFGIPVKVTNLGVISEVRLVLVPPRPEYLDAFLNEHEELNASIPNVVIVTNRIHYEGLYNDSSDFHTHLNTIKKLRHRLFDDNYSNLMFQLRNLTGLIPEISDWSQLEEKMVEFEKVIWDKLDFLNPVPFSLQSEGWAGKLPRINGYIKLENGEYFPKNLKNSLLNICAKNGDPLGHAILKAYFLDSYSSVSNKRRIHIPTIGVSSSSVVNQATCDGKLINSPGAVLQDLSPPRVNKVGDGTGSVEKECGCEAIRTQLNQQMEQLKSECSA